MSHPTSRRSRAAGVVALLAALAAAAALSPLHASAAAARSCELRGETEGPTNYRDYVRPRGTVEATVFFVDFADAPGDAPAAAAVAGAIMDGAASWLRTVSGRKMRLRTTVREGWLRMPGDSASYNFENLGYDDHERYIRDAVAAADPVVDFSETDIVYIISPRGAAIPLSPTFVGGRGSSVRADGNRIGWGVTFGNDVYDDDPYGSHVAIHETLHTFGLPDLYRESASYPRLHHDIGAWDIMGSLAPGFGLTSWHLRKLGWLSSRSVRCLSRPGTTTASLKPLAASGRGLKALIVPLGRNRVYVIESRQSVGADKGVCRPGVLIYKVDGNRESGRSPIRALAAGRRDIEPCEPLADATWSRGRGRRSTARDRRAKLTVKVLRDSRRGSRVRVTVRR